ncbi:MAG: class I SAM-dependent methyltransferase [Thermomicrobiales bacterium]
MGERSAELRASYDRVAGEYAARIADELAQKPFDRALLDQLAAEVGGRGTICDLGCGPGQVAGYLHERGAAACGIDLSPAMVAEARRRHPGIDFQQGDIGDLAGVPDRAFGGVAAFYSLIHIERERMVTALREIGRVLRTDGVLLAAFHVGDHVLHLDEWWGRGGHRRLQLLRAGDGWVAARGRVWPVRGPLSAGRLQGWRRRRGGRISLRGGRGRGRGRC